MNSIQLSKPDGQPAGVWVCTNCPHPQPWKDQQMADNCCACSICHKPMDGEQGSYHSACQKESWARHARNVMEAAEKLESWDGRVYWAECPGRSCSESYFENVEAVAQHAQLLINNKVMPPEQFPEYVYVAEKRYVSGFDLDGALEDYIENEEVESEFVENLEGTVELQAAVKAFNEANAETYFWFSDEKRAVRVPPITTTEVVAA